MAKLLTDWIKIGQSGPTTDGRTIDAQWLLDAAESYNPDTYTAVISVDHFHVWNFGTVVAVKAEEDDGIISLYARLCPNKHLLERNADGQKLFTSMELDPDFAESGRCYLVGLAITDYPASLGTSEIHFSRRKFSEKNHIVSGVELPELAPLNSEEQAVSLFRKAFQLFSGTNFSTDPAPAGKTDEEPMDKKQFGEIMSGLTALQGHVAGFDSRLQKLEELSDQPAAAQEQPAATPEATLSEDEKFSSIETGIQALNAQFSALAKRMELPVPGTSVPASTTPAGDSPEVF